MNTVDVYVRYSCGAYVTNTLRGIRSSSTSSADSAAKLQADKLFGPALQGVAQVDDGPNCTSVWRITADADKVAWCWATGLIEFGDVVPEDAAEIARGPDRALRSVVEVVARHAKPRSGGQLLVPGVPEARDQQEGMTALLDWLRCCGKCHPKGDKKSYGVEFWQVPAPKLEERVRFQRVKQHPANPFSKGENELGDRMEVKHG